MTNIEIVRKTIHHIDQHIKDALTASDLADDAGFSLYYFHRLFTAYTGLGLMHYVRQRKMAYARLDVTGGLRILDVALNYGYGSERAFTRAFQNTFGITPSACRHLPYVLSPELSIHSLEMPEEKGVFQMDYFSDVIYKELKIMTVVSKTIISTDPEEEVIGEMNAYMQEHGMSADTDCYGFDVPVSEEVANQGIRGYEYWAKVTDGYKDKTVEVKIIPGYNYAVLTITDPFANPFVRITDGWKALILWLENNRIEGSAPRNAACLEKIHEEEGITYMDLMIPVTVL